MLFVIILLLQLCNAAAMEESGQLDVKIKRVLDQQVLFWRPSFQTAMPAELSMPPLLWRSNHFQKPKIIELIEKKAPLEQIEAILRERSCDVNIVYNYCNPLLTAISQNDENMVNFLIEYGAQVNLAIENMSPLKKAIDCSDYSMVALLIAHGANVNRGGMTITSPLERSIVVYRERLKKNGKINEAFAIIGLLKENGAKINWQHISRFDKKRLKCSWKEIKDLLNNAKKQIIIYQSPEFILFGKS